MRHSFDRGRSRQPAELLTRPAPPPARAALEARWLHLTRETLPALAPARGWPVRADHCFQRILLDAACGGCWYDYIAGRPAYAYADDAVLGQAVALGEAVAAGDTDLADMNRRSLTWRGKAVMS